MSSHEVFVPYEYLQIGMVLFGPLLIRKALTYYNQRKLQPKRPLKRRIHTNYDTLLAILHIVAIGYQLFQLIPASPNMFSRADGGIYINADTDASDAWIVNHLASNPHQLTDGEKFLKSRLRSRTSRCQYAKFGPETFEACRWCKEENDYRLFTLPIVVGAYALELAFLGFSTSSSIRKAPKTTMRRIACVCLLVLFVTEVIGWTIDTAENRTPQRGHVTKFTYINANFIRRISFACLHLLLLLKHFIYDMMLPWNAAQTRSDADLLGGIIGATEALLTRTKAASIQRLAVWRQHNLRQRVGEYHEQRENDDARIKRNPVYRNAVNTAGFNLDDLDSQAKAFVDGIVQR